MTTTTKQRIPLAQAETIALRLVRDLEDVVERIEVVGSIRRRRDMVADIELLVIPKIDVVRRDLFGNPDQLVNRLDERCDNLHGAGLLIDRVDVNGRRAWGEKYKRAIYQGVPVDLFSVLPTKCGKCGTLLHTYTGKEGGSNGRQEDSAKPDSAQAELRSLRDVLRGPERPGVQQELLDQAPMDRTDGQEAGPQLPGSHVPGVRQSVSSSDVQQDAKNLLQGVRDQAAGEKQSAQDCEVEDVSQAHDLETGSAKFRRLCHGVSTSASECIEKGSYAGTPPRDGATSGPVSGTVGTGTPYQRNQTREPYRESGDRDPRTAQRHGHLPSLSHPLRPPLEPQTIPCCPNCGANSWVGSQWGVQIVIRTGAAEFSKRVVTQARKGGSLPNEMFVQSGGLYLKRWGSEPELIPTPEEQDFFDRIGMPFIEPTRRH